MDINKIDLNLLRTLGVLLDTRSVTLTARSLGVTQPTVSAALARLRDAFGDELFVRQSKGLLPTDRARAIEPGLKDWLRQTDQLLLREPFDPSTTERIFRVVATDYAQMVLLPGVLGKLNATAPKVRLASLPINAQENAQALESGHVDLILTLPGLAIPIWRSRILFEERYVVAMRNDHPAPRTRITLKTFTKYPHIVVSPRGGAFGTETDRRLDEASVVRKVSFSTPNFAAAVTALEESDCIALLPRRLVERYDTLRTFVPPIPIDTFSLIAAWHERSQNDPGHQWFRSIVAEQAR